jgi:hypothetical protein
MVGMAMGDHGMGDRPHGVDVEIARRAIETFGGITQELAKSSH